MDYVIVDTAGRLHTKDNLMAELEKMRRTAEKVIPAAPHEVLLVLDATTGQNGLEQARKFTESSGVTGIVLTKLDGTAKGGVVVAIARELNLPIRYVGVGRTGDDLLPFEAGKIRRVALCVMKLLAMNQLMQKRCELAARGEGRVSPNPAVGAVLVRDGEIVGRGFHTYAQVKHAEIWRWKKRRSRARRHALRHFGTVLAPRADAALRRCADHGRRAQRGRGHGRSQSIGGG